MLLISLFPIMVSHNLLNKQLLFLAKFIKIMKNLAPQITRQRLLIEGYYGINIDEVTIESYLLGIASELNLATYGKPMIHTPGGTGKAENQGFDAFIPLIDSGISLYVWTASRFFASVLFTCKTFDTIQAVEYTRNFFATTELEYQSF